MQFRASLEQTPKDRGSGMARDAASSEDGRHDALFPGDGSARDGVRSAFQSTKAACADTVTDRFRCQTGGKSLPTRDNSVLPRREL